MFKFAAVALCAISAVRGISIPIAHRDLAHYDSAVLENYTDYSTRYQLLGCAQQHNTQFFTDCCHPLLKGQTLQADRKPYCIPQTSSASVATPTSTEAPEDSATPSVPAPVNAAAPPPSSSSPSPTAPAAAPSATGFGTYFYQHNTAGACGTVHKDSDRVVALDSAIYDGGSHCGKKVHIINLANGHSTDAIVADECPTCLTGNSLDLSEAAFQDLADLSVGQLNIVWWYTD